MTRCSVLITALALCCGCAMTHAPRNLAAIHLHDSPQNARGFSSGINPDTIRVVTGGQILPREQIEIVEIKVPEEKADPGSPNEEFIVRFDPSVPMETYGTDVHLLCRDYAGNPTAFRLVRGENSECDWEELLGAEPENLYTRYFDHLKSRRKYWQTAKEYEVMGEGGGFLIREGKVVCGWGMDMWELYEVTGSRFEELQELGLERVGKVEGPIWGTVDNESKTIEIRDYKITKIYPKRRVEETRTRRFSGSAGAARR